MSSKVIDRKLVPAEKSFTGFSSAEAGKTRSSFALPAGATLPCQFPVVVQLASTPAAPVQTKAPAPVIVQPLLSPPLREFVADSGAAVPTAALSVMTSWSA